MNQEIVIGVVVVIVVVGSIYYNSIGEKTETEPLRTSDGTPYKPLKNFESAGSHSYVIQDAEMAKNGEWGEVIPANPQ